MSDNGARRPRIPGAYRLLGTEDRLADILVHPAFAGYAHLLLPWDDRSYDEQMPLRQLASLLPYHSQVSPAVVVGALNHMIDDVNAGKPVFYPIYNSEQIRDVPSRSQTGLFYFRGRPGAPFAVISPGGGFAYVGAIHEGFPYARDISQEGYNAFVLRYRATPGGALATQDLAAAITFIFERAEELEVSIRGYSLWGSSAGARMAAAIGSSGTAAYGETISPRPAVVVTAYTGLVDHGTDDPATFVVVGDDDGIAPPSLMKRRATGLRRAGTTVEYHQYPGVGHGFGTGTGTTAEGWISEAVRFWAHQREPRPE